MDKPKKETVVKPDSDSKLCLNCGFPNRNSDSHCMYCQQSLVEDSGFFSWLRQTYYVIRWRWQLKQKREGVSKPSRLSFLRAVGYFVFGVVLSGVGIYVFTTAIDTTSFSKGLIAILFLLYGGFIFKSLFNKN